MDRKEKRQMMDTSLKEIFVPVLRKRNFKGSYPHFRREAQKQMEILGIRFSSADPRFYIDIAVSPLTGVTLPDGRYLTADKVKISHAAKSKRIGKDFFSFEKDHFEETAIKAISSLKEAEEWWIEEEESA